MRSILVVLIVTIVLKIISKPKIVKSDGNYILFTLNSAYQKILIFSSVFFDIIALLAAYGAINSKTPEDFWTIIGVGSGFFAVSLILIVLYIKSLNKKIIYENNEFAVYRGKNIIGKYNINNIDKIVYHQTLKVYRFYINGKKVFTMDDAYINMSLLPNILKDNNKEIIIHQ